MNWFSMLKGLKCPMCKKNTLETARYIAGRVNVPKKHRRDTGTLICTNCGHKEVFN